MKQLQPPRKSPGAALLPLAKELRQTRHCGSQHEHAMAVTGDSCNKQLPKYGKITAALFNDVLAV